MSAAAARLATAQARYVAALDALAAARLALLDADALLAEATAARVAVLRDTSRLLTRTEAARVVGLSPRVLYQILNT